jgi:cytochrome P450
MGNGLKLILEQGNEVTRDNALDVAEEVMRVDPPLHMFTRYAYEEMECFGHTFQRGDQVALMLGAANHDPEAWPEPTRFDATRRSSKHTSFGGGLHFCVGAPLARLELQHALPILLERLPNLKLVGTPQFANLYHFHGLERLIVSR